MHFKEIFYILQKTTLKRSLNIIKIGTSYLLSKLFRFPVQWGFPMTIAIEPTTACNLHCPECPSGLKSFNRETGNMRYTQFLKFVNPVLKDISCMIFYFQGEPFINGDLFKMIHHASTNGIYTMSSTNAHFLDYETSEKTVLSGLDRLIISMDGTTQETYEKYRIGGHLSKVLDGINNLIKAKKNHQSHKPLIYLQFIIFKHNEHQVNEIKKLAYELQVDKLEFKTAQVYNYQNGSKLIPEAAIYSRYKQQVNGTYSIKNKMLNECWRMWQGLVITWDGKVVPCCFDKDANHILGNLQSSDLKSIWKNENYFDLRKKLFSGRKNIDICRNCTEGTFL